MTGADEPYECAVCHGAFIKGRSDEEARADQRATWAEPPGDSDFVCDDCFLQVVAWASREAPELLRGSGT